MIAFLLVGAAAVAAAIGVVTARSAVHSVLWLIAHLCGLAVLYMTLQAQFLGLVQVLIYAGAVMVLFLFVLGLLSARRGADASRASGRLPGQLGFGVAAAVIMAGVLLAGAVGGAVLPLVSIPSDFGTVASFGKALFGPYLLPFEATALALLTAIVAVVALNAEGSVAGDAEPPAGSEPGRDSSEAAIDVSHAAAPEPELAGRGKR